MKLHILGCGDAFGSGGRNQSGYLVEAGESLFLLDCGPTTLLAMKRGGHDPRRLVAVILSHLHGDHFAGLPFFFIQYLYLQPRDRPLTIAGPPGTADRVTQLHALMYGSGGQLKELPAVRYIVLTPGQTQMLDGLEVFPFRVTHQTDDISLGPKSPMATSGCSFPATQPGAMNFSSMRATSTYFYASARFSNPNLQCM